ncbi:nicotinate phosphoribosyltransferase [Lactococcus lactis subsp. lactis]|uniref:hypothetical protein n=1 Tax=Lactococcus lactis TaxID=1358 RepID=UPI00223AB235|nr:hypothetical protein [Lactococcus lactis]MCT0017720.1 nicotinate phosphoribosyltransferase [Lactococcus lactis subsp. lactis]
MLSKQFPHLDTDFYKVSHVMKNETNSIGETDPSLHPVGITELYETLTPRENSYFPYSEQMTVYGYEFFVENLVKNWQENFFNKGEEEIISDFDVVTMMAGQEVHDKFLPQMLALHKLGYLPLEIKALPEGFLVPMRVPVLSIVNTHPNFYWLPGYLETTLLANTFVTSTVASYAREFRKLGQKYADLTADSNDYLDFQFHDFSQRGQHGDEAGILAGISHLTCFKGSDQIPAVKTLMDFYKDTDKNELIGASVVATEHSIMESLAGQFGTNKQGQIDAFKNLIERNPSGILSIVSDTYDYWEVIDEVLPSLKELILARDGKLVIRPDSLTESRMKTPNHRIENVNDQLVESLKALYEVFGGAINSKGYKVLDQHIGLLHGEGITLDNLEELFIAIEKSGFSTENIVLGVGAYTYSVKPSRDDFGQALKASSVVIGGKDIPIFKQPKSENEAFKRSPRGAVSIHGTSGNYSMIEGLTIQEARNDSKNQMNTLLKDGVSSFKTPFSVIRERIQSEI